MNLPTLRDGAWLEALRSLPHTLRTWPWYDTFRTLRQRFREDQLSLTASSLAFTTTIALVPLITVMLALFTAFPVFSRFRDALQQYLLQNLVPDNIAKPVLGTLTQFAGKASQLGGAGLVALVITAMAVMLTIDRTLNRIWRVRKARPIAQRVLVYWAALTLGPVALGVSLSLTSLVLSENRGVVRALPGGLGLVLDTIQFLLLAAAVTGLFRYVPNTHVRWRHAAAGGLFVAVGFEVAKKLLAWYLAAVPGLSLVYGAFATVPILLLWTYLGWVIVLLGAVIAAYAPSLQLHLGRPSQAAGGRFLLALELLAELDAARQGEARGLGLQALARRTRTDPLAIEPVLEGLQGLGWVGTLEEPGEPRRVLLCEPATIDVAPLVTLWLLRSGPPAEPMLRRLQEPPLMLGELLPGCLQARAARKA